MSTPNNLELTLEAAKYLYSGVADPRVLAYEAAPGTLYLRLGLFPDLFQKLDEGKTTNWNPLTPAAPLPPVFAGWTPQGTLASPINITAVGGITPTGIDRENIYVTATGDVLLAANPQIAPGTRDGQELKIWYIGAGSLTIYNGDGIASNGDITLINNSQVQYMWNGSVWGEENKNDI